MVEVCTVLDLDLESEDLRCSRSDGRGRYAEPLFARKTTAMYTLYFSPGTASMVVHQILIELGVSYELRRVDLDAGAQRDPAYLRLNPGGVVPTLLIDDQALVESSALAMILAERHPEAGLSPALGSPQRPLYLQWMLYLANTLQPAYRLWFYPHDIPGADAEAVKTAARAKIEAAWQRFHDFYGHDKPYLLGAAPTALDFYALMLMRWSRNMPKPATQWPRLAAFAQRMKARPSWKKLYEIEGLTEWA